MGFPLSALKTIVAFIRKPSIGGVVGVLAALPEVLTWLRDIWGELDPVQAISADPVGLLEMKLAEVEAGQVAGGGWAILVLKVLEILFALIGENKPK